MKIRVSLIEDNPRDARFCRELLQHTPEFEFVSHYSNAQDALAQIQKDAPEIVLLDLKLPGCKGFEILPRLKEKLPSAHIVMLTVYDDEEDLIQSFQAGASGYVLKRDMTKELIPTLESVTRGESRMTGAVARMVLAQFRKEPAKENPLLKLSERETEVLEQIGEGLSDKEIASALTMAPTTVHTHLGRIYEKLRISSRTQAAILYARFKRASKKS